MFHGETKCTKKSNISETKLIRELAKILQDTDLSEIEMEKGDLRLRVARMSTTALYLWRMPLLLLPLPLLQHLLQSTTASA